jgi:gas vesicle protein
MTNDRIYYSHDAEIHAVREMTKLMVVCLIVGLGIGAAVALLFAPSSGKTTRRDLAKSVEEGLQTGRETVEPMVKRVEKEFGELKKDVEEHMK